MADNKNSASASINVGWLGLLGVVLVVLKLNPGGLLNSPVQDWSWWLVLLPFYVGLIILLAIGVVALVIWGGVNVLDKRETRKRRKAIAKRQQQRLGR